MTVRITTVLNNNVVELKHRGNTSSERQIQRGAKKISFVKTGKKDFGGTD